MAKAIAPPSANLLDELVRDAPEDRLAKISYLKHRIDHLFLPTAVDLQGVVDEYHDDEKKPHERTTIAKEYLREVFQTRVESEVDRLEAKDGIFYYYRNRLNRARYLAVGCQKVGGLDSTEAQMLERWVESARPEAELPDSKRAMWDLVKEALEADSKKDKTTTHWTRFVKLLGLNHTGEDTFASNMNSPIQQFMNQMDEWLNGFKANNLPDLNRLLNFFVMHSAWGIESIEIKSFGDWFSELVDSMDQLRESLKDPRQ